MRFRTVFLFLNVLGVVLVSLPLHAQTEVNWQRISGPEGAFAFQLFCVDSSGTLWGAEEFGRMFRSTDDGVTWSISSLPVLPRGASCAVNGDVVVIASDGKVWRSEGGDSWGALPSPVEDLDLFGDVVYLASDGSYYATSTEIGTLMRSVDEGENWTSVGTLSPDYAYRSVRFFERDTVLLVLRENKVSRLHNGVLQEYSYQVPALNDANPLDMVLGPNGVLYRPGQSDVARSADDGQHWDFLTWQEYADEGVNAFDPGAILIRARDGLYVSTDTGKTWTLAAKEWSYSQIVLPGGRILSDLHGHLATSTDMGQTWESVVSGLTNGPIEDVVITSSGTLIIAGYGTGVSVSHDMGQTWSTWKSTDTVTMENTTFEVPVLWYPDLATWGSDRIVAATNGGLYRSEDLGQTWQSSGLKGRDVLQVEMGSDERMLALMRVRQPGNTQTNLWLVASSDLGKNWDTLSKNASNISYLRFDAATGKFRAYLTTANGWYELDKVTGLTVRQVVVDKPGVGTAALRTDPVSGNYCALGYTGPPRTLSYHESDDGGVTWVENSRGLEAVSRFEYLLGFLAAGSGDRFVLTDGPQLFKLRRGDTAWQSLTVKGASFPSYAGGNYLDYGLSVFPGSGRLLAYVYGSGLYLSDEKLLSVPGERQTHAAQSITVYPNPAVEHIRVVGDFLPGSFRTAELFDISGRSVADWAVGEFEVSADGLVLNVPELPDGLYILNLHAADGAYHTAQVRIVGTRE